jgi:hypothetical protein
VAVLPARIVTIDYHTGGEPRGYADMRPFWHKDGFSTAVGMARSR